MTAGNPEVTIVLGTRPEIIKLAPVIHECERRGIEYALVHTGQHYSENLDRVFFDRLELPPPDHDLGVGSGSHGEQTGEMLEGIERVLLREEPEVVIVQGDTNSTLAGALAASKLDPEIAHVEAGLRSFDEEMPEETNRVLTDHMADYLFAPTEEAADLLREEGLPEDRITVTGNTIVDAVTAYERIAAERSTVLEGLDLRPGEYLLLTAHRAENVDDERRFSRLLEAVERCAEAFEMDAVYPIHPRAREAIDAFDIPVPDRIRLVEPLDFLDFLRLEREARLIFTDSGGVQEEACILRTPCVTFWDNTERPETVSAGANRIAGVEPEDVLAAAEGMCDAPTDWPIPFGEGDAAVRILNALDVGAQLRVSG